MKRLTLILMFALSMAVMARDLTLFDCYEKAEKHHPLQTELENRRQLYELNKKNLNAKWLPKLDANLKATYMSHVVEFDKIMGSLPIPLPPGTFQNMPKEQYKATLDVTQTLFDGGVVHAGKLAEQALLLADEQAVEVQFYKMRDRINQTYFALLMLEKQQALTRLFEEQVKKQRGALLSGVANGVILPSNVDVLNAELINIEQKLTEIHINRQKLTAILEEFIGAPVSARLDLPEITLPDTVAILRPETRLFDAQKSALEANKKVIGAQRWPKAMLFGTYGYGKPPGNDFFTDEFDDYYLVGAGLVWNIFDWNSARRRKQALLARQNILDAKRADFERMIRVSMQNARAEIERLEALLESDARLIELRRKIAEAAASQLQNGVISATEYLTELNAQRQARINLELHKIQLVQAKVNYLTISGQM